MRDEKPPRHQRLHERVERHHDRLARRRDDVLSRRQRRRQDTREEILAAAREVLLERGAADLSLREVARRAGFTPGALYKYFDSKDDVVSALADRAMSALLEAFAGVPAGLPPDERAVEMGMAYLEFAYANPQDVAVILRHDLAAHDDASPTATHRELEDAVKSVFRDGARQGVFAIAVEDADYIAYGAWALVQGLAAFEQQQRPELVAHVRDKQRRLLCVYTNGLKSDWSAPAASDADSGRKP
jgi:AcrR family transcriptional regulator